MANVSLFPRNTHEWLQEYNVLSKMTKEAALDLCSEMEKELGASEVAEDLGQLKVLLDKTLQKITLRKEDNTFVIIEGKEQEYANLYSEFEKRFSKLENQEKKLYRYFGKGEGVDIENKRNHLSNKMKEIRDYREVLLFHHTRLNFVHHNRFLKSAANIFICSPINTLSSLFQTKKIETLALLAFGGIAVYTVATNTHASFLVKTISPLFFMYIGYVFSKVVSSDRKNTNPPSFTITMTPEKI